MSERDNASVELFDKIVAMIRRQVLREAADELEANPVDDPVLVLRTAAESGTRRLVDGETK